MTAREIAELLEECRLDAAVYVDGRPVVGVAEIQSWLTGELKTRVELSVGPDAAKLGVEHLRPGDKVRAVEGGPVGTVERLTSRGWTLVRYPRGGDVVPYKHGEDRLYHCGVSP